MKKISLILIIPFFAVSVLHAQNEDNKGKTVTMKVKKTTNDQPVFLVVEEMPSYPGGEEARFKFLQENIIYPMVAKENDIEGIVYVTFVVEEDGSITDVQVLKGIGGGCDEEAVRVIRMMPKWNPGKQTGKAVRVQFNIPVKFILSSQ